MKHKDTATRYYSRTLSSWPVGVTSLKKKKAYASTPAAPSENLLTHKRPPLTHTQQMPCAAKLAKKRRLPGENTHCRGHYDKEYPERLACYTSRSVDAGRHQLRRRQSGQKPPQPALLPPLQRSLTPPHLYPQSVLAHTHRRTD